MNSPALVAVALVLLLPLLLPGAAARAADDEPAAGAQNPQQTPGKAWIWCGLRGGIDAAYVGDVHERRGVTKFRLWSDSSRFLRVVNSTYGERLESTPGICRSFPTESRALSALSSYRIGLQGEGRTITVIGVY